MDNKTISYYLKHNILKPYLIHVEFELLNILTKLKSDKVLKRLIELKGYTSDIYVYETGIQTALLTVKELIKIHRVD